MEQKLQRDTAGAGCADGTGTELTNPTMNLNLHIRSATLDDAEWMLAIYAPVVRMTASSFEEVPPKLEEFCGRIERVSRIFPWLVCLLDEEPAGYAYAAAHRPRAAYAWSVETSVYVAEKFRGRGLGKLLYARLFDLLREQGYRNVYGGVTLPNPASVALHKACGFDEIGVHRHAGFKLEAWHDVLWMQLDLWDGEEKEPKQMKS